MLNYILKRLLISVITIWFMFTMVFFLMHSVGGSPFRSEKTVPKEVVEAQFAKFGLDKPVLTQYFLYTKNVVLHGDFGISFQQMGRSVNGIIATSFPQSMKIGLLSIIIALLIGIPLGMIAAIKRNSLIDKIAVVIATIGISVPSFAVATILLLVFSMKLMWLPSMGLDTPQAFVLPVIALSFFSLCAITRLMRSSMLDVIHQDYIRTARAKGLSENAVILKHALKNAILPVITYMGPMIAFIVTGSFVIESIFSIPGLGQYFVKSIFTRDYSVIMGTTVFLGFLLISLNFLTDIIYVFIDPRIKLGQE